MMIKWSFGSVYLGFGNTVGKDVSLFCGLLKGIVLKCWQRCEPLCYCYSMPAAQPEATPAVQFILPFTCLKNFKSCFPTHLLPEGRMITIFLFYVDSTKNTGSQSFKQKPKLFAVALVEAAAVTVANASAAGVLLLLFMDTIMHLIGVLKTYVILSVQLYGIVYQHPSRPQQMLNPSAGFKNLAFILSIHPGCFCDSVLSAFLIWRLH